MKKIKSAAVLGLGQFGISLALEFMEQNVQVLAADINPSTVERLASKVTYAVTADLTDAEAINGICAVLLQLTPEDPPADERFPTPEWYSDAWQAFKDDPGNRVQEDITLEIRFCNGTVMQNILYQPFIGNGYVDGMKELTPEQNNALRSCFQ